MGPFIGIIILLGLGAAAHHAVQHARSDYKGSRERAEGARAKEIGQSPLPPKEKAAIKRRHRQGWWAREVGGGFPVIRTGWHTGWLAHQAAASHARTQREETRLENLRTRASLGSALPGYREERDRLTQEIGQLYTDPAKTVKPTRKGIREAAADAKILPFRPKTKPGAPSEVPTRRPDGKPETAADTRVFDERESGYKGPLNADGFRLDARTPEDARAMEILDDLHERGGLPVRVPCPTATEGEDMEGAAVGYTRWDRNDPVQNGMMAAVAPGGWLSQLPADSAPYTDQEKADLLAGRPIRQPNNTQPTSGGGSHMAEGAETTYDQTITKMNQVVAECEDEIARLQRSRIPAMVDELVASGLDPRGISRAAEVSDAISEQMRAAQQARENAISMRHGLQSDHGNINAAHQDAPVEAAHREFYH